MSQQDNIETIEKEHAKGNLVVLFAGAHGKANALDSLLDASKLLKASPVTICLMGTGPEKERLQKRGREEKLTNVLFLPAVNKNEVGSILEQADILYIGLAKTDLFRFGISPNKMMDYMLAGKPIISAIDAGNDMVAEAQCGYSVPAEDSIKIAEKIRQMLIISEEERSVIGEHGRAYVLQHHDYRVLAEEFINSI